MADTAAVPPSDTDPVEALDALIPGLGDAVIDLLDAVHDRTDDIGPAGPEVLNRLASRLTAAWPTMPPTERPLVLLDALRAALKPVRP